MKIITTARYSGGSGLCIESDVPDHEDTGLPPVRDGEVRWGIYPYWPLRIRCDADFVGLERLRVRRYSLILTWSGGDVVLMEVKVTGSTAKYWWHPDYHRFLQITGYRAAVAERIADVVEDRPAVWRRMVENGRIRYPRDLCEGDEPVYEA